MVNVSWTGAEPAMNPLLAFLANVITVPAVTDELGASLVHALGLVTMGTLNASLGTGVIYQPSVDELAQRLWSGVAHTAAATMLLAQTPNATYTGVQWVDMTGRTRNMPFVRGAAGLAVLWLTLLLLATAAMGRRTFGNGISSYVVARLFVDMGELVDGHSCGEMSVSAPARRPAIR
jgi:hypothetical protein